MPSEHNDERTGADSLVPMPMIVALWAASLMVFVAGCSFVYRKAYNAQGDKTLDDDNDKV